MTDVELAWIRQAYLVALIGGISFLAAFEDPQDALPGAARLRHVLRNLGIFALVVFLADGLVLGVWLHVPFRLTESNGLLTGMHLPVPAILMIGFLTLELIEYGFHRLSHRWRWLWRLHAVHHSDMTLDASTGLRSHPLEVTLSVLAKVAICLPLGIPLWIEGARAIIANPWAMYQHANLPARCQPGWLDWLLATPAMHAQHHSTDPSLADSNFGVVLSCWDRIFGTYRAPALPFPAVFGIPGLRDQRWQGLWAMCLTPICAGDLQPPRRWHG